MRAARNLGRFTLVPALATPGMEPPLPHGQHTTYYGDYWRSRLVSPTDFRATSLLET